MHIFGRAVAISRSKISLFLNFRKLDLFTLILQFQGGERTSCAKRSNSSSESTLPLLYHRGSHTPPSTIEIAKGAVATLMPHSPKEIAMVAGALMLPLALGPLGMLAAGVVAATATARAEGTSAELTNQERYKVQ